MPPFVIDLATLTPATGFVIQGDAAGDQAGFSVASAGDFNGDGQDDLILGAPTGDDGGENAGEAYVVYGRTGAPRGRLDLTGLASADGLVLEGARFNDRTGSSVASAGDINGDGVDDLIVGAPLGSAIFFREGEIHVVYGVSGAAFGRVDLSNLVRTTGFTINGDLGNDDAGRSVSSAGDINGDGINDLLIGAPRGDDGGRDAGEAYVIYGRSGTARGRLDLTNLGLADGFVIQGDAEIDGAGSSVASAGDVNGDGLDDLIVGAPLGSDGGLFSGEAYVIYGRSGATRARVDLTGLSAADGFAVQGDRGGDYTGRSVAAAGDVNGDGLGDLIIGAPNAGEVGEGVAYVVYGRSGATRGRLDLTNLAATDGFAIQGDAQGDRTGFSVASAGDFNGDGLSDLIIGAYRSGDGGAEAGNAFVVYGRAGATRGTLDLTDLDAADGFTLRGAAAGDRAGRSVASAGDINGDGYDDVIVGAPSADGGGTDAGEVFVVYGFASILVELGDANSTANQVVETAASGALVGLTARATDSDSGATIRYDLTDDAEGRFAIDTATGVVTLTGSLDFESFASHHITVRATSSGGGSRSADFTIAVTDANDPLGPLADSAAAPNRVAESAAPGARVGLIARALDPDSGDRVRYALTDDAGGRFAINAVSGVVTVAGALDFESARSHVITVRATSTGGDSRSASFTIAVTDADDPLGPLVDIAQIANRVAESAEPGARTGLVVRAIDPDARDRVSYALTDDAGGRFAIDARSGVVTLAGVLDFESARSHQITVQATSSGGGAQSATFTIAVTNVAEGLTRPGTPTADTLIGTPVDDRFTPGAGSDTITGRGGRDIFVFASETRNGVAERDVITDFTPGDRLDLGPAQIFRELQVNGDTVLILDGDRDQIRLTGLADFDPLTMLV